jgi:exo-beta-1,3-glucanase (GH17 family)/cellulose synthase/poly-beta-1,6-N-acetylglucosamine synthase-like glycosyltransferase
MKAVMTAVLAAAALHAAVWYGTKEATTPADVRGPIEYVSYSPYVGRHDPKDGRPVSPAQIEQDMQVIAEVARGVRTYSTIDGVDKVPALAEKAGLNVILGAWVGDTPERDREEIDTVVQLAKQHRNVKAVLVGNEVLFRDERSVDELVQQIRDVKKQVRVPVSTGEIWQLWLENPKLVNAADFIVAHFLPYWDGVPAEGAEAYVFEKIELLRKAYPGKRIIVGEFGWPSQGYNRFGAIPDRLVQAQVIRDFIAEADRRGIEYNIVEAFDQEWKTNEGSVGAYWGMWNADRTLKWPLTGPVEKTGIWWKAALAIAIGALLTIFGLRGRRPRFGQALTFALAANGIAAAVALALAYPVDNYLNVGIGVMWAVGIATIIPLTILTLAKVYEMTEVLLGRRPRRLIRIDRRPQPAAPQGRCPMVSIQIPAYREPPEMLIQTLDSLAALDYPNFEAIVIVNNTPEARFSAPVAARCRELGPRFKFLDITCTGFKAGALNVAMQHTHPDAEILAVLDADYVVRADWLRDLVPAFDDPDVALVQAPQDHRDGGESPLKRMMNAEYAGFFDIGMVQRNEDDAIITHGTMCLVRRSAFEAVGGWGTDTIVEDTDLGLRLYEAGYQALYTNTRYGHGLLPDTYKAFKTQRFRWAYGAMQLIRKHGRHMLPQSGTLKPAQKFHFTAGWALWLADAVGALAAVLNLLWVPVILIVGMVIPTMPFTVPIIAAFVVNLLHCLLLYGKRVDGAWRHIPGAAVAAMSLQWTVARAVLFGLLKDRLPFLRTDKGGNASRERDNPAFWETVLGLALASAAALLIAFNHTHVTEMTVFAATLAIQSLPFLAAGFMVMIERSQGRMALFGRRQETSVPVPVAAVRPDAS